MEHLALFIGSKIRQYRKQSGMTQTDLADKLHTSKQTISKYEKGIIKANQDVLFKLVTIFNVSVDDFFPTETSLATTSPDAKNGTVQAINDKVVQLHPERQEIVLEVATEQLKEQEEEAREIHEPLALYSTKAITELAAGLGYSYDDNDIRTVQVEEEPPRHDIASIVNGDSMLPDYENGDIVYLKDTGFSSYSGQVCAVAINDKSYLKKVYTEDNCLRLVSINPKYDDIIIDFPPSADTHIKIYAVVGSGKVVD
ncbi:repressor [Streptococcus satellite phage Javan292]|uniref:XRE family transcriptional regulator n=1 Tax=Streptococcus marmotae TaxID=1825069 RepID=UPI000829A70B|nr:S24 family peptidase [Streptococcus marmotae]QBX08733.1 repressor [Streptococcus satellite phage Javan292]QBX08755.1 transcriptional repressor [Streptococcus satellite phage Javan293]